MMITGQEARGLVSTAQTGVYFKGPGHPAQVIAYDASGKALQPQHPYAIAADRMPATLNMKFEHTQDEKATGRKPYVFLEQT
ncbi:MAG: hypothetical protein JO329_10535 [Planctomycetaceae bacterium]|nr:hypothetical protein [Planctomycetaceae bacterium]MBV8606548.1 hypothetical protein [Singulisphaera sp.]